MSTPLYDAVDAYLSGDVSRLHMPGHKGLLREPLGGAARWDVTELPEFPSLFEGEGPIAETAERYREHYGTAATFLSAGGSTLCIQAMLALTLRPGDQLISARNIHGAAVNAMALLDLRPAWIAPVTDERTGLILPPTPEAVEYTLHCNPGAKAVYLTSPDYYGLLADIPAIAGLCHRNGKLLLVDNAHGAHLNLLDPCRHPMAQGADFCCDSLHKTLPVLTGGALLHVNHPGYIQRARERMALFGSTSPSYLILLSIDRALDYLETGAKADLTRLCGRLESLRRPAAELGITFPSYPGDPARLTLGFFGLGLSREEFLDHLSAHRIVPEYVDDDFCVLLPGLQSDERDLVRLERMLRALPRKKPRSPLRRMLQLPVAACSIREATFAPQEPVSAGESAGRIAGQVVAPCPPGVPVLIPGERISAETAHLLAACGNSPLNVLQ